MLSFSLENFKSFGSKQKIPLKPITLIYGANSSGKSSVIHGYLFIREVLKTNKFDLNYFTIGGELLDLGGHKQYLHKKEYRTRSLFIEVELANYKFILEITADGIDKKELKNYAYLASLTIFNYKEDCEFKFTRNKFTKEFLFEHYNNIPTNDKFTLDLEKPIENQIPQKSSLPEYIIICNTLNEILKEVNKDYKEILYLGPIRSYPTRDISLSNESIEGLDYNAWSIVKKDSEVRNKINKWLGGKDSKLKTGYELSVKKFVESQDYFQNIFEIFSLEKFDDLKFSFIEDDGLTKEDFDTEDRFKLYILEKWNDYSDEINSYIVNNSSEKVLEELVIKDLRTDTTVSHRDIGVGISQVLPVLVSAYASTNAVIAIEQPELHLHPALQSEIADVFIETALKENNTYLIETHSEHLLLRIMRRIRETTNNELAQGLTPISKDDVQILFVMPGQNVSGSVIKKIDLDEEGELIDEWPGGFFEEGYNERFGI